MRLRVLPTMVASQHNGHAAHPAVSIVLPTYQRGGLIGRAIRSVLAQTHGDFELLVVDDGSTDDTAAEVARITDPRVRYTRLDVNRGVAAARNLGIRATAAPLLAFQDSDDEWLPNKLERHLQVLAASGPGVGVVYSDMERVWDDGRSEYHRSPDLVAGCLINPETSFYQVCRIGIQATVIRRVCLDAVGAFDERFPALEDLELFIRLSRRFAFHHLEEPLVRYHETDGLSKNYRAKHIARRLLLATYERELMNDDPDFVERERVAIEAGRPCPPATSTA